MRSKRALDRESRESGNRPRCFRSDINEIQQALAANFVSLDENNRFFPHQPIARMTWKKVYKTREPLRHHTVDRFPRIDEGAQRFE